MAIIHPGLLFYCRGIEPLYPETGLYRTASVYSHGSQLETQPESNRLYVICADGSVQDANDTDRPIGWEVIESADGTFYRLTQVGFEPRKVDVHAQSMTDTPPRGGKQVGTVVFFEKKKSYSREEAFSQEACIQEAEDDGGTHPDVAGGPHRSPQADCFAVKKVLPQRKES